MHDTNRTTTLSNTITITIFLTLATFLIIPNSYSIGFLCLFLASCFVTYVNFSKLNLTREDRLLLTTFLIYTLGMFFLIFYHSGELKEFSKPLRFLLIIPMTLMLLKIPYKKQWLFIGACVGAILALLLALYQVVIIDTYRAHGALKINQPGRFGYMALVLGLLSFSGSFLFYSSKKYRLFFLCTLGGLAGLYASFLSGTRGGWVALPILIPLLLWQSKTLLSKKVFYLLLLVFSVFIIAIFAAPQTNVLPRVAIAKKEIQAYLSGESKHGSLPYRLEMFKASIHIFKISPIFGSGEKKRNEIASQLSGKNTGIKPLMSSHAHSDYFEALSVRGITGLFLLMIIYLIPLKLFINKIIRHPQTWNIRAYAVAGTLVTMAYMSFSISGTIFNANITTTMYLLCISFFWSAIRQEEDNCKKFS